MEGWATIRYLHAQGKGIRAIAKECCASLPSKGQPKGQLPQGKPQPLGATPPGYGQIPLDPAVSTGVTKPP